MNKDSAKYNTLKYSYKCAAYANQNAENNYMLALKFAQEGYLKDSNNSVLMKALISLFKSQIFLFHQKKYIPAV